MDLVNKNVRVYMETVFFALKIAVLVICKKYLYNLHMYIIISTILLF